MPYYKGNQEAHMSYYNWQPVYEQHNEEIRWFKTRFGLYTTQVQKDGEWVNSSTGATLDAVLVMTKAKLEYERTGEGLNCYIVGDAFVGGKLW